MDMALSAALTSVDWKRRSLQSLVHNRFSDKNYRVFAAQRGIQRYGQRASLEAASHDSSTEGLDIRRAEATGFLEHLLS